MTTRRSFLRIGGAGLLAVSSGCTPPFALGGGLGSQSASTLLAEKRGLDRDRRRMLGYPINMNTPPVEFSRWRERLRAVGIDEFAFNNVGNPFAASPIPCNTHDLERETIREFGKLYRFPTSDTWGFLSHSGTDSNMHGMYMGRTILTGRTGRLPKAYFTPEAHYSVQILRDLLGLDAVHVACRPDGSMDPGDLRRRLAENDNGPALVVATVGTTFKGAVDSVAEIRRILLGHEAYLHVDAALFGGYLPYTPHADTVRFAAETSDGTAGPYDSLAVSCHKFFGFPSPAGLFLTRQTLYREFNEHFASVHDPAYIHQVPGTITCSRDAVKPAEFYFYSRPEAAENLARDAELILENATYLHDQLRADFETLTPQRANAVSNTIYFRCPKKEIVEKYSLATMDVEADGRRERYAHVVVMPHVTRSVLGELLSDLKAS